MCKRTVYIEKILLKTLLLSGLVGCQAEQDGVVKPAADCLVRASANTGQTIAGQFIVTIDLAQTLTNQSGRANARLSALAVAKTVFMRHKLPTDQLQTLVPTTDEAMFVAPLDPTELAELQQDPAVLSVEPDRIMSICDCVDLTAPRTLTWNVQQTGYGRGDTQSGKTVWIIDTGIDLDHPDLNVDADRSLSFLATTTTGTSAGASALADDQNGHGTHVAGIIGALNNGVGVTGVASGARLVALKVLNQLGEGRLSGIISAVNHVARTGKAGDVVNLSLGGEGNSPTLERAVRQAADLGILFAVAAGNEGESTEEQTPARINHPNVFTVIAIDRTDQLARFSNYGASVDVAAYGVRIQSTYRNGQYATLSGTSMAAPHIAGLLLIRGNRLPTRGTVFDDRSNRSLPIGRE